MHIQNQLPSDTGAAPDHNILGSQFLLNTSGAGSSLSGYPINFHSNVSPHSTHHQQNGNFQHHQHHGQIIYSSQERKRSQLKNLLPLTNNLGYVPATSSQFEMMGYEENKDSKKTIRGTQQQNLLSQSNQSQQIQAAFLKQNSANAFSENV